MYFNLENSSSEFVNIVETFEETFYKKYVSKDLVCFQCTFLLKNWNDMLNIALAKNLVSKTLFNVCFVVRWN